MSARKKVLLKVIILGDSGYVVHHGIACAFMLTLALLETKKNQIVSNNQNVVLVKHL